MIALILAAGYATRLYPLTKDKPKALLPVSEQATVLDLILDKVEGLNQITRVILVSNHKYIEMFEAWRKTRKSEIDIEILDDGTTSAEDRLGAIGDLQYVIEQENPQDDLMVLAGDNLFTFDLQAYVDYFYEVGKDCLLVKRTEDKEELRSIGVAELDLSGRVIGLEEKPQEPRSNIGVYALYLYKQATLKRVKSYLEEGNSPDSPTHFPEWLIHRQEVRAFFAQGEIFDIGTHESYQKIRERFLA